MEATPETAWRLRFSAVNEDAASLNRAPGRVTGAGPEVSSMVRVLPDDPLSSRLQVVEREDPPGRWHSPESIPICVRSIASVSRAVV